jgi:hypothetical protein
MATGPEHYHLAERFLERYGDGEKRSHAEIVEIIGMAQAHATLALAAANGMNDAEGGMPVADCFEWQHVAGVVTGPASR